MWTWRDSTGELLDSSGALRGTGYSGAPGAVNDPSKDSLADIGPIPIGVYSIHAPIDSPEHGPYAMPLLPVPGTNTFGRAGFMIHGDSIMHPGAASHGCLILARKLREAIWTSNDHNLQVVDK